MTTGELAMTLSIYYRDTPVELRTYQDGHEEPYAVLVAMPHAGPDQIIYEEGGTVHD